MNSILQENNKIAKLALGFLVVYMISIVYSKFLLSLSLIFLVILSIYETLRNDSFLKSTKKFISTPVFSILLLCFLAFLVSGVNSQNIEEWLHQLKLKLPFILLPYVFFVFRKHIAAYYENILLGFSALMFLSSLPILFNYLIDFDNITASIGRGHAIPTPVDHIKYSLFVAFACISLILLIYEDRIASSRIRSVSILAALFLFIYLHVLAVRSGLAVFYCSFTALVVWYSLKKHLNKVFALGLILSLLIIPIIAVKTIPSLERKWGYMKYDLEMFMQGKGAQYSDSERLYSYAVGTELFLKHPILGVGVGDLLDESEKGYIEKFDMSMRKYPHNMYLFLLSGLGILGFILVMLSLIYPAFHFRARIDSVFLAFCVLIFSSFLVENTIQRSYSTAFFLFFYLLGISYLYEKDEGK